MLLLIMSKLIYIADDEENARDLASAFLEREGYSVNAFPTGDELLAACEESLPDMVILDIMMPGSDGLSVCSALRQRSKELPIIITSVRDSSYDRVAGLSLGCNDYIIKPYLPLELTIRVRSLLARSKEPQAEAAAEEGSSALQFGPLTLYPNRRSAILNNEPFSLSPTEFDFLIFLIKKNGAAVSREELLQNLWQVNWEANTRATDDLVKRLRRKFREAKSPIRIETVWGYGFRIALASEENQR